MPAPSTAWMTSNSTSSNGRRTAPRPGARCRRPPMAASPAPTCNSCRHRPSIRLASPRPRSAGTMSIKIAAALSGHPSGCLGVRSGVDRQLARPAHLLADRGHIRRRCLRSARARLEPVRRRAHQSARDEYLRQQERDAPDAARGQPRGQHRSARQSVRQRHEFTLAPTSRTPRSSRSRSSRPAAAWSMSSLAAAWW